MTTKSPPLKFSEELEMPKQDHDDDEGLMRILGRLEADVRHANEKVGEAIKRGETNQAVVRQTLDTIMESFRNLKAKVDANSVKLEEWEPLIEQYRRRRWEAQGRRRLIDWMRVVWVTLGGALAFVVSQIYEHWPRKGG